MKKQRLSYTIKVEPEVGTMVDQILAVIRSDGVNGLSFVWKRHLEGKPLTKGGIVEAAVAAMHRQICHDQGSKAKA